MSETIHIQGATKQEKYESLLPQIKALLEGETDAIANMANISAALKEAFNFFWVGFYLVKNEQLVLGPFQGPVACTRINIGKGVCGSAWQQQQAIIVDDVDAFPGHIACSALSKSEIVIPLYDANKQCIGVLDVDSDNYSMFDKTDEHFLTQVIELLKL